ncbi:MAG: hypothetical protein KF796_19605 [Ramlibacter sp.]|nr:hypothetical protein [Ramlibacter sp.]
MTPQQQAFEAALKERLGERGRVLLAGNQRVIGELASVRVQILTLLASQPADWQQWQLTQILDQVTTLLAGATGRAATVADGALRELWQQGEDIVDKPLAAAGLNVEMQLPLLDTQMLTSLRRFTELRLKDVGAEASRKIGNQLSLVTLGASTPFAAMQAVQRLLGTESPQRAATIVRTEVGRAFALATNQRQEQAVAIVPGLQKQWRRSGKIHSRWNHDAIDGQVVDVSKPFVLPSNNGPVKMMHPHDPTAPIEEVINCGCLSLPFMKNWQVMTPGAKPFTGRELQLDGRKAALDQAAKRAGMRQS